MGQGEALVVGRRHGVVMDSFFDGRAAVVMGETGEEAENVDGEDDDDVVIDDDVEVVLQHQVEGINTAL